MAIKNQKKIALTFQVLATTPLIHRGREQVTSQVLSKMQLQVRSQLTACLTQVNRDEANRISTKMTEKISTRSPTHWKSTLMTLNILQAKFKEVKIIASQVQIMKNTTTATQSKTALKNHHLTGHLLKNQEWALQADLPNHWQLRLKALFQHIINF